jgi:hypothetical protein
VASLARSRLCGLRLGCLQRGDDHQGAVNLLRGATRGGAKLAVQLQRLPSLKDAAHYGMILISARSSTDAMKWAAFLVQRSHAPGGRHRGI